MYGRALVLLALTSALAGCNTAQKTGSLEKALTDYEAGHYALAAQKAGTVAQAQRRRGAGADEAAYLAGLSAYRLGNAQEAEEWLLEAASAQDRSISARARATLGLIRLEQHRPAEAAALFVAASPALTGEDARLAALHAANAFAQAGDAAAARRWWDTARRLAAKGTVESHGFCLQVGAFNERARAERAASEAARVSGRAGLGSVRIIPATRERNDLYLVQFGRFPTRQAASEARSRIGQLEYIVRPAATQERGAGGVGIR